MSLCYLAVDVPVLKLLKFCSLPSRFYWRASLYLYHASYTESGLTAINRTNPSGYSLIRTDNSSIGTPWGTIFCPQFVKPRY